MFPKESRILIVDDSQSIRNIICEHLMSMGFSKLETAEDVPSAQKKMETTEPFDLILSDLNMPGQSGIDFLRFIRSHIHYKHLPFLLITTESDKKSVLEAAILGVTGYIIKPFNSKTLRQRLLEAWQKNQRNKAS